MDSLRAIYVQAGSLHPQSPLADHRMHSLNHISAGGSEMYLDRAQMCNLNSTPYTFQEAAWYWTQPPSNGWSSILDIYLEGCGGCTSKHPHHLSPARYVDAYPLSNLAERDSCGSQGGGGGHHPLQ